MKLLDYKNFTCNGINVHVIPTEKFKTNTITLKVRGPLNKETVTYRGLLPYVLQSGTSTYPTNGDVRRKLEELYGATFFVDVAKKGDYHVMSFIIDIANEKYLTNQSTLLDEGLSLLAEIWQKPYLENGVFSTRNVDTQKRVQAERIKALNDDKLKYANQRLIEEMFKGESYELLPNGILNEINNISSENLYEYYQKALKEDMIDLYIVGDVSEEQCKDLIQSNFVTNTSSDFRVDTKKAVAVSSPNEVIEEQKLNQAKLHIGYTTGISNKDADYFALQVFNGLFGGFSHSKLFINVREKNSLAYYAASRFESHKGLLMVMSGIASENYEKATTIITEQLEEMRKGNFTDDEIDQTKLSIKNSLLEGMDTAYGIIETLFNDHSGGNNRPIEQWITEIEKVTRDEIIEVSKKIALHTTYFLKGEEGVK
ncbi:insulinase family protein [Bacillus sp. RG28]|uniref:Insulinase family protein n=1 Tax=Gottfriedia endophytica TaxID=2820819 RepID=A0A940NL09_9BACI|nr:pitrilysin family protein [Gottfriedia endophytica]MBP0726177.1 insulinase family protein [Gottfriedia endophytica]